ncbi:helix-turn-helix transcriptional regulator [Paenibacillus chibensis]|uniref:Helix-turn-helix transcriptional regulator n=1 Tax=Paenibacillus chibensis TaxID=59846 RepID=A0ABU6PSP6_9BACL|nr:helix-turn-helix transcriptional regulator [Paenibacillus chibensis]
MRKNEALAGARKNKGLTQEELASLLGYSKATVSNWENGYSNPSLSDAFKISRILNKDINKLFSGLYVQDSHTKSVKESI